MLLQKKKRVSMVKDGELINHYQTTKTMKTKEMELRVRVTNMSKSEMIELRDELENNWNESLRLSMDILSLGCLSKFKTTLSKL